MVERQSDAVGPHAFPEHGNVIKTVFYISAITRFVERPYLLPNPIPDEETREVRMWSALKLDWFPHLTFVSNSNTCNKAFSVSE